jgi:hypothetical protein
MIKLSATLRGSGLGRSHRLVAAKTFEAYLLYCTQRLAVISDLATLYTRGTTDDSMLCEVSKVERMTTLKPQPDLGPAASLGALRSPRHRQQRGVHGEKLCHR